MKAQVFGVSIMLLVALVVGGCGDDDPVAPSVDPGPEIIRLRADRERVQIEEGVGIRCLASDSDGDSLAYQWETTAGQLYLTSQADSVFWEAPGTSDLSQIVVAVSDGKTSVRDSIVVMVCEDVSVVDSAPEVEASREDSVLVRFEWRGWGFPRQMLIESRPAGIPEAQYDTVAVVSLEDRFYVDETITSGDVLEYRFSTQFCFGSSPYSYLAVDRDWPVLVESSPADNDVGVSPDTPISLVFSEPIDPEESVFSLMDREEELEHEVQLADDGLSAVLVPTGGIGLLADLECRVALVDTAGNKTDEVISFSVFENMEPLAGVILDLLHLPDSGSVLLLLEDRISEVDFSTGAETYSHSLEFYPTRFALNPMDGLVYVTSNEEKKVFAIDLMTGTTAHSMDIPSQAFHDARVPRSIAFAKNGVGFLSVFSDRYDGSGNSLYQIVSVEGVPEFQTREEFMPGEVSVFEVVSSDRHDCVVLMELGVPSGTIFKYSQSTDEVVATGYSGIFSRSVTSPESPHFISGSLVRTCEGESVGPSAVPGSAYMSNLRVAFAGGDQNPKFTIALQEWPERRFQVDPLDNKFNAFYWGLGAGDLRALACQGETLLIMAAGQIYLYEVTPLLERPE